MYLLANVGKNIFILSVIFISLININMINTVQAGEISEFTWIDDQQTSYDIAKYVKHINNENKRVLLHFWASWCAPCRHEMPILQHWIDQHPDVVILPISLDNQATAATQFLQRHKNEINMPLLMARMQDANKIGVRGLPSTFIVNGQGDILLRKIGMVHWDNAIASQNIMDILQPN
ncbi:MAG: TlpA disulfide reductase family protein [Mariprofundales bacterium]